VLTSPSGQVARVTFAVRDRRIPVARAPAVPDPGHLAVPVATRSGATRQVPFVPEARRRNEQSRSR
jgi:hypothetical protein